MPGEQPSPVGAVELRQLRKAKGAGTLPPGQAGQHPLQLRRGGPSHGLQQAAAAQLRQGGKGLDIPPGGLRQGGILPAPLHQGGVGGLPIPQLPVQPGAQAGAALGPQQVKQAGIVLRRPGAVPGGQLVQKRQHPPQRRLLHHMAVGRRAPQGPAQCIQFHPSLPLFRAFYCNAPRTGLSTQKHGNCQFSSPFPNETTGRICIPAGNLRILTAVTTTAGGV